MRTNNTISAFAWTFLLALAAPSALLGQGVTFDVRGSVRDTAGRPVEAAYAQLWQDSVVRASAASDGQGHFTLRGIPPALYTLRVSCLGYAPEERAVSVSADLQPIVCVLEARAEEMDAVRVVESRTRVSPEGNITFRAEGVSVAKGRSTLELLRFVQGLTVNREAVLINGRAGTRIFLGDSRKTISIEELRALPATEIARIVVEPFAGVEFGASDEGGIVRVYLAERAGLSGTLQSSVNTNGFNDYWSVPTSLMLRYQKGRFYMHHKIGGNPHFKYRTMHRNEQVLGRDTSQSDYLQEQRSWRFPSYDMALSYEIDEGHGVSLYTTVYNSKAGNSMSDSMAGRPASRWADDLHSYSGGVALEYVVPIPAGEESSFELWTSYTYGGSKGSNRYNEEADPLQVTQNEVTHFVEVAPTFSFLLAGEHSLRGGLYFDFSLSDFRKQGAPPSAGLPRRLDPIAYDETGGDVRPWFEYSKSLFGDRLYLQAGVTGFYYWAGRKDILDSNRSYSLPTEWGIFPKLLFDYTINHDLSIYLQGSYSFSYSLPNYNYFTRDVTYVTSSQYSVGNEMLRMEYVHMAELSLLFLQGWQVSYRFNYSPNMIAVMTYPDPDNPALSFLRPENAGRQQSHYLGMQFSGQLFDFWYTSNALYGRYALESSADARAEYFAVGGSTTQDFTFYPGVGMDVSFAGAMGAKYLNKEVGPWYYLDAGLYANFLDDRLQFRFEAGSIVYSWSTVRSRFGDTTLLRTNTNKRDYRFQLRVVWAFMRGSKVDRRSSVDLSAPSRDAIQL